MSRSTSALPSSKKTHSEKHKLILKQLLKEEGNKVCVDCKTAAHPRWASWNLGCFICIRCSGIHRSMGTHISKVKSVDLDAWTDEQVELMVKWGNSKCNSYWENKLPEGYIPDNLKIENFIRTKYDMRKWVGSVNVPDPLSIKISGKVDTIFDIGTSGGASNVSGGASQPPPPPKPTPSHNLLDDDFGSFTSASATTSASAPTSTPSLPKPQSPLKSMAKVPIQSTSNSTKSAQSTGGSMNNNRPDLKKSILSLYSSPSSSTSSFNQPQFQSQPQLQPQSQPHSQSQTNDLSNSLLGLNFNSAPVSTPSMYSNKYGTRSTSQSTIQSNQSSNQTNQPSNQPSNQPKPASWNNEWSDMTGNNTWKPSSGINTSTLDDDLFKNVWK